jgi:hypothetical protein
MNYLTSWIKGWSSSEHHPSEKPEQLVVSESLLLELEYQLQEAEIAARDREQEERKKQTGVDYSWLITKPKKLYEISELEKLELEEVCMKVKASECSQVINMFREALVNEPKIQDIPRILRAVINQVLDVRPKEDTMSEWMMKSLTKLKKPASKVTPVDYDGNEMEQFPMEQSRNSTRSSSVNDKNSPVFKRIEDLPV